MQGHLRRSSKLEGSLSHMMLSQHQAGLGCSSASQCMPNAHAQNSIVPTLQAKAGGLEVERDTQTTQQLGSQAGLEETLFLIPVKRFWNLFLVWLSYCCYLFRVSFVIYPCLWCHRCSSNTDFLSLCHPNQI